MRLVVESTPSALAAELKLRVNRLRGNTKLAVVPMLVVEGESDTAVFSQLCTHGAAQVFLAGGRKLVEQLLSHLKREPIDGCKCVFLVDCDGCGKTPHLANEEALLVTETCDIEADLVNLGVAGEIAARFLRNTAEAEAVVKRACAIALPISVVRRAAHAASTTMKHERQRQLRIDDLPEGILREWEETIPSPEEVVPVVAAALHWSTADARDVLGHVEEVVGDFSAVCLGKDALDALYRVLQAEGSGDIKGWNRDHFHRQVFASLRVSNCDQWEVTRRLRRWEGATGVKLLRS